MSAVVPSGVVAGLGPHRAVVRFAGQLTLRRSADGRQVLVKLLASYGEVLVDLSSFRLAWHPAAAVFATALSTSGTGPAGRLPFARVPLSRDLRGPVTAFR